MNPDEDKIKDMEEWKVYYEEANEMLRDIFFDASFPIPQHYQSMVVSLAIKLQKRDGEIK